MAERPTECGEIGAGLVEHAVQVFIDWQRYQSGKLKRSTFKHYTRTLRKNVESLLEQRARYTKGKGARSSLVLAVHH